MRNESAKGDTLVKGNIDLGLQITNKQTFIGKY